MHKISCLLIALSCLLSACTPGSRVDVQKEIGSWVGHDTDQLVRQWGPPDRTYQFRDGSGVLNYEFNRTQVYSDFDRPHGAVAVGSNGSAIGLGLPIWNDPTVSVKSCDIKFETDAKRMIHKASYTGTNCAYALVHTLPAR